MHLVFVHGWAFDASFWDLTAARLADYSSERLDLGFFGQPSSFRASPAESILIGHSLGFAYGMRQHRPWKSWVAINSFSLFIDRADHRGCVPAATLRDLGRRLKADTGEALKGFYGLIDAAPISRAPDLDRLIWGLDQLRDCDPAAFTGAQKERGLVLAARNDPLVPEAVSQTLALNLASDMTPVWHETGGHILPLSDPEFCARQIRLFLQSLDNAS